MTNGQQYYATLLLVYLGVDIIAALGLNLQFGVTGILNFAFIIFQSIGAYTYALFTLGAPGPGNLLGAGFQTYIWGTSLPFPLPFIAATLAAAGLSFLVGALVLPRLRGDYQAMAFLVVSLIATGFVTNQVGLLNGSNGLSLVPKPLMEQLGLGLFDYGWFYVGLTAVFCVIAWWVVHRITSSPLGRALRTVRENEHAALALGKDVQRLRMLAFVVGGGLAGLSGALLVGFISAWAPGSWTYAETFVYITAVIVGGFGSNLGVIVGVLLVPILFGEFTRFLPEVGQAGWIDAGQLIVYGVLTLAFLWFRPRGVFPERRVRFARPKRTDREVDGHSAHRERTAVIGLTDGQFSNALLEVKDLHREFGGVLAVDGVSFSVPAGTIVGLIGPNGAGKSTVIGMIGGAILPTSGSIRLDGKETSGLPPHQIARRGLIRTFQLSAEFPRLTVMQNLLAAAPDHPGETLAGAMLGKRWWDAYETKLVNQARDLLERFNMSAKEDSYAGDLSGGQRRLLEVMRALMAKPRMLLLDEPTAGVHPSMIGELESQLAVLRDDGLTMVMVEHELGIVERLCKVVVVMSRGKVIAQGPLAEVRAQTEVREAYFAG